MREKIIAKCYKRSVDLLRSNSNKYGVMAASGSAVAKKKLYVNIFGRDASICTLGMVASGNKKLMAIAKQSLKTLAQYQTELGEIPATVNPATGQRSFYFLGSIDSTLWWLLAIDFYHRHSKDKQLKLKLLRNIKLAIRWLEYQDQNNDGLLEEGESSNWTDDMPDNGRTLYSNVLWYQVLGQYGLKQKQKLVGDGLNTLFLPHVAQSKRSQFIKRDPHHRHKELVNIQEFVDNVPYYLHYVSYRYASDRLDVYANSLAILFNVAQKARAQAIARSMRNVKVSRKYPVQVLVPPIFPEDHDWRPYLDRDECANKPFGYHNGGIWPYVGGFYAMALKKAGKVKLAEEELKKLAQANQVNGWEFNEWFHGKSGKPMGMIGQSWNAGTFLLAYHYLQGEIDL